MSQLEMNDIQGNILVAYRMPVARFTFLRFDHPENARWFVAELIKRVTSARPWETDDDGNKVRPESTCNVGFTHKGLVALELPLRSLLSFPREFQEGMRARARLLGDDLESAPANWDDLWTKESVHAGISISGKNQESRDATVEWFNNLVEASHGVEAVGTQDVSALPSHAEHFGYTDGFSNPFIAGTGRDRMTRRGKLAKDGVTWEPLAAGEFLLGHADEAKEISAAPVPNLLARNGTFMVYRKLKQDVMGFRSFLKEQGEKFGDVELFAAKLVGRWRDGTPLVLCPDSETKSKLSETETKRLIYNNDFTYKGDLDGEHCPRGAHIRRANPRDDLGFKGMLTNRRRIIRRGLPYGTELPQDATEDDGKDRGIVFIALNASIERQFEFIQSEWMNYGNDFLQGNDKDPIVGNQDGTGKMLIPGEASDDKVKPPFICGGLQRFVITRGGEYFFIPSLTALDQIAAGKVEPM